MAELIDNNWLQTPTGIPSLSDLFYAALEVNAEAMYLAINKKAWIYSDAEDNDYEEHDSYPLSMEDISEILFQLMKDEETNEISFLNDDDYYRASFIYQNKTFGNWYVEVLKTKTNFGIQLNLFDPILKGF